MSFGKLTITTESGEVEEYEIDRPTISVGRQPGNDIVLNTSAVSRYHAQFDATEGQVFLVDQGTVNGTYINDRQLASNERVALKDGDVILIGDFRMIFASPQRPRGTGPLSLHTTEHTDARIPVKLVLDNPETPVAPGAFLQFAMMIENHSGDERLFTIEADGMEQDWIRVNRREVRLANDEQTEVLVSVRPPRSSTTSPGRYPLRIRVLYKDDPTQAMEVLREVDVLGYSAMAMAIRDGKTPGQYFLAVQNQGNQPLELDLAGYQANGLLRYQFTPSHMVIPAGQTQQVILRVAAAKSSAQARPLAFAVVARSLDRARYSAPIIARYSGKKASSGWLPSWLGLPVLGILALAVLALAAGGVALLMGIIPLPAWLPTGVREAEEPIMVTATPLPPSATSPPTAMPTPVVNLTAFSASPNEITFGTAPSVTFTWQIDHPGNVQGYSLKENETNKEFPLPVSAPSTGRAELETGSLVSAYGWGEHTYTLTITGTDGVERSSSIAVKISPVTCKLLPAAQIFAQPGPPGGAPITPPVSKEVAIGGRTEDSAYVQVWSLAGHDALGWVRTNGVQCPLQPALSDYIEVTPGPPPAPTLTPAG